MREIKFRAWDDVTSKMYHTGEEDMMHFYFNSNGMVVDSFENTKIPFEDNLYDDVITETLEHLEYMQYTGLKDKNGTEIYDGDYIRYSMRTINGSIYTHVCRVFQHESGTWRIEGYHEDNHSYETKGTVYATHLICEVIGNIYENPELVK